jgi:hypothetical protein
MCSALLCLYRPQKITNQCCACFDFSSSNFNLQGNVVITGGVNPMGYAKHIASVALATFPQYLRSWNLELDLASFWPSLPLHSAMSTLLCTTFLCVCSLYATACAARTGFLYRPLQPLRIVHSRTKELGSWARSLVSSRQCVYVCVGGRDLLFVRE